MFPRQNRDTTTATSRRDIAPAASSQQLARRVIQTGLGRAPSMHQFLGVSRCLWRSRKAVRQSCSSPSGPYPLSVVPSPYRASSFAPAAASAAMASAFPVAAAKCRAVPFSHCAARSGPARSSASMVSAFPLVPFGRTCRNGSRETCDSVSSEMSSPCALRRPTVSAILIVFSNTEWRWKPS